MKARDLILDLLVHSPPISGPGERAMTYDGIALRIGRTKSTTWLAIRELLDAGLVVNGVCPHCRSPLGPRLTAAGLEQALKPAKIDPESN